MEYPLNAPIRFTVLIVRRIRSILSGIFVGRSINTRLRDRERARARRALRRRLREVRDARMFRDFQRIKLGGRAAGRFSTYATGQTGRAAAS